MTKLSILFLFTGLLFAGDNTLPLTKPKPSNGNTEGSGSVLGKPKLGPKDSSVKEMQEGKVGEPKPYIASVGTYGSKRINEVIVKENLGSDLDVWLKMGLAGDPKSVELEEKLAKKIKDKFNFPFAEWSVIQFFEPGDLAIHITLDVVEKEDMATRMPFVSNFTEEFKDPDNLLQTWAEYENTALDLVDAGQIETDTEKCKAFHCPFGHKHPKLAKYEKIFVEGAAKHFDILTKIQSGDKREEYRGAATYVLAYHSDGKKVIERMLERIKDPSDLVRNNALRVLGEIAELHTQFIVPMKPIVAALDYPKASDRAKAAFLAHMLAMNSQQSREELIQNGIPSLLKLLAQKQPDQKEFSHAILRKISGKEFAATDLASWNNWYQKIAKERGLATKKQ